MANRYTKTPAPNKTELELLYFNGFKTQIEIGVIYGVSQKIVFRWFKELGIVSRVPYKRNQIGVNNSSWNGNNVTYAALHYRVQSVKGKACKCEKCGRSDDGIIYDWANQTGNYNDIEDYKQMCRSCHFKMDGIKRNFPNNNFIPNPNPNKRKLIDGKQK